MKIALIGYGRLGKLITRYLCQDFEVAVFDQPEVLAPMEAELKRLGVKAGAPADIPLADIVIPCVPISSFKQVVESLRGQLREGQLVIDVCSVKEYPLEIMRQVLPTNVHILGTHPMFGPDSAAQTLFGCKIVLCPERLPPELYAGIKAYLHKHGLLVIEASATDHDQQISETLVLTHLIGRTLIDMKASSRPIDTKGHRRLMRILETVENDSIQLFHDMNGYNRFAAPLRKKFLHSLESVMERLKP